jgi:homoserine O-acetyltransferase/O-succinyltransferase
MDKRIILVSLLFISIATPLFAGGSASQVAQGDVILKNFKFNSGETLPEIRMHYRTLGQPKTDEQGVVRNAVLVLHGTGGDGASLMNAKMFAGELFGKGQPLDASKFFIIAPDVLGHGKSSKPSDGLRARFPKYGYNDMILAQYRMLTEGLQVNHLRLVMGTSMGGMHTWLWGGQYPEFMDALMPLASLPTQISGRNRIWRRTIIDAIRNDPGWMNGDYKTQPSSLRTAAEITFFMGSNSVLRQKAAPTREQADKVLDKQIDAALKRLDANDALYYFGSSFDYDPGANLEKIKAPLVAVNFADDLINPPELGILEKEIKRVPRGKAVLIPFGPDSVGHGTHTKASVWKHLLVELLQDSEKPQKKAAATRQEK